MTVISKIVLNLMLKYSGVLSPTTITYYVYITMDHKLTSLLNQRNIKIVVTSYVA